MTKKRVRASALGLMVLFMPLAGACGQNQGAGDGQSDGTVLFPSKKIITELRDELKTQKEKVKNLKGKLKKEEAEEFACASINEANKAACTRSCWWNNSSKECAESKAVGDCNTTDMKACGRSDQCAVDERYQEGGKCYNIAYTTHCNSLAASGKAACEATLNGQQRCDYQAAAAGGCAPVEASADAICAAAMRHVIDVRAAKGKAALTAVQQENACENILATNRKVEATAYPCNQSAPSTIAANCKARDNANFFTDGSGGDAIAAYCTALGNLGACKATFLSDDQNCATVVGFSPCKEAPTIAMCTAR